MRGSGGSGWRGAWSAGSSEWTPELKVACGWQQGAGDEQGIMMDDDDDPEG